MVPTTTVVRINRTSAAGKTKTSTERLMTNANVPVPSERSVRLMMRAAMETGNDGDCKQLEREVPGLMAAITTCAMCSLISTATSMCPGVTLTVTALEAALRCMNWRTDSAGKARRRARARMPRSGGALRIDSHHMRTLMSKKK
jgi:hypothetical protein